jgi:hypothetical protein
MRAKAEDYCRRKQRPLKARLRQNLFKTILTAELTQLSPGSQNVHAGAKKEQHAERKAHKSEPPEWTGSVGIPVVGSVVHGVISSSKTESSMKPVLLKKWKDEAR